MLLPTHEDLSIYPRVEIEQALTQLLQQMIPASGLAPVKQSENQLAPSSAIFKQMDALVRSKTGTWYWGTDFAHPESGWCSCHKLFGYQKLIARDDIPSAVNSMLGAVDQTHEYVQSLREFCDAAIEQGTGRDALEHLSENMTKMIRLTIGATNCDSSWYFLAGENLNYLIAELELSDNEVALMLVQNQVENLMESRFESWVAPNDDTIADVTRQVEIDILKELFDKKYV